MDQQMIGLYQQALSAIKSTFAKNQSPLKAALTCSNIDIRRGTVLVLLELYMETANKRPHLLMGIKGELLDILHFALQIESDPRQKVLLEYARKEIAK